MISQAISQTVPIAGLVGAITIIVIFYLLKKPSNIDNSRVAAVEIGAPLFCDVALL
jgi:hypothetical protein